ncbi:MAG: NAD(+) kinase, partial [Gammaproteobacteria bacterium]|nr:NAD(+) kinase [Gammaproteobacteria bacterium]
MFKRIALITNSDAKKVAETLNGLIVYLQSNGIDFILDQGSSALAEQTGLPVMKENKFDADCDLAIAIGGDGTMLNAAHLACKHEIPLLGINRGRLGFLADIPADAFEEHLNAIFAGTFVEEERFMLNVEVLREGKSLLKSNAFNDVILQKWNIAKLVEFETYVDGSFVHRQRSDGLIVTTPTGSTAYALSGGGPILHPSLDALALVPICPHTLTNRPIVIDGNSVVEIVVGTREIDHARLTCDGDVEIELAPGDRVRVQKKDKKIKLIHPQGHDHFSILRAKLQWGTEVC